MNELKVTWNHALKVWWSIVWRALLFCSIAGFVAGFVVGFFGANGGVNRETITILSALAGAIVGVPVGIWVIKIVLQKRFSGFRLALIATD